MKLPFLTVLAIGAAAVLAYCESGASSVRSTIMPRLAHAHAPTQMRSRNRTPLGFFDRWVRPGTKCARP